MKILLSTKMSKGKTLDEQLDPKMLRYYSAWEPDQLIPRAADPSLIRLADRIDCYCNSCFIPGTYQWDRDKYVLEDDRYKFEASVYVNHNDDSLTLAIHPHIHDWCLAGGDYTFDFVWERSMYEPTRDIQVGYIKFNPNAEKKHWKGMVVASEPSSSGCFLFTTDPNGNWCNGGDLNIHIPPGTERIGALPLTAYTWLGVKHDQSDTAENEWIE